MTKTKEYSNGEVTVVWKPELCIHSGICVKGLPDVFQPKEKPWVKIEEATTQQLIDQVKACPSGALGHYLNSKEMSNEPEETIKVEVREKGPLMVHGDVHIVHSDGRKEKKERLSAFCRCGASSNKPFCDGSHNDINFDE